MTLPTTRRVKYVLVIACAMCSFVFVNSAAAQFHIPGMGGGKKNEKNQPPPAPDPTQMPQIPPQAQQRQQRNDQSDQAQAKPPGVPVSLDSPLYAAFKQLEQQSGYRIRMTMITNDPRFAQMAARGMGMKGPTEIMVRGNTRQVVMHMGIPATDIPNTIDDWEIRGLVQDGKAARLITSPAVPRIIKLSAEKMQMQMAMLEQQAAGAVKQAMAQGPAGAVTAGLAVSAVALAAVMAPRLLKKEKDFFSWQCTPTPAGADADAARKDPAQLTDLRVTDDQMVEGVAASAYEFYVRDGDTFRGPVHMLVAKDTGLPFRLEMTDPQARGGMQMDYYDVNKPLNIEVPSCLANGK
jgi:hypothetical protein